jgi:hypothetical protein
MKTVTPLMLQKFKEEFGTGEKHSVASDHIL